MGSDPCTTSVGAVAEREAYETQIQRDLRWNFAVNVADGAFFWLALSFAAPSTIMPLYVSHLTDNALLIGLVTAINGAGWYLPQLLTANYVERMPVKKKLVINLGLFTERLPFVVMAASVFAFAGSRPDLALVFFFLTFTWHTLGAGIIAVAWQDMVAKVIPSRYRGRLLGLANAMGTTTGMLGSAVGAWILARYPFPTNYGICVSLLALFILASWGSLALTREPPLHSSKPVISLRQYAQRLPEILRRDRNFAAYLATRVMTAFAKMGIGFVAVYAVQRWKMSDSQAGLYTTVLLAGETAAYLGAGALGDKRGHKLVLELSLILLALAMLVSFLAPSPVWMYVGFAAMGTLIAADILSGIAITMEFSNPEDRPTYIGLANTVPGLFSAVAPLLGGLIALRASYTALFLTAALLSLATWGVLHWLVREPRHAPRAG
jgi:MFS family permease